MNRKPSKLTAVLRAVGIAIGVLVLLIYIGLPAAMGVAAIAPARGDAGTPPEGFEDVTFSTADGVELRGWYLPPQNGAVILLIHGAGDSRNGVRSYAAMLASHGYGVFAIDLRGHGESEGRTNRLGWQGTPDVSAAVAYLESRLEVKAVGGMGLSMGGEVLLGAASANPQIKAIVADGASRRSLEELLALEQERPLVRNFTARVMYATVRVFGGVRPPEPLLQSMQDAPGTQFFFIAAGEKELEVAFNELFAQTLGGRGQLWVVPGAAHVHGYFTDPDSYEEKVISFFDQVLLKGFRD